MIGAYFLPLGAILREPVATLIETFLQSVQPSKCRVSTRLRRVLPAHAKNGSWLYGANQASDIVFTNLARSVWIVHAELILSALGDPQDSPPHGVDSYYARNRP